MKEHLQHFNYWIIHPQFSVLWNSLSLRVRVRVRVRVKVALPLTVYNQSVRLGDKPLEINDQKLYNQMNACVHSPCITSSLTRGCVSSLQLLLAVILRSDSSRTRDHIRTLSRSLSDSLFGFRITEWVGFTRTGDRTPGTKVHTVVICLCHENVFKLTDVTETYC
jgi:hypothetical protein